MIAVTALETDADLLSRTLAGDTDAFGALFARHAPAVLRFCFAGRGTLRSPRT